MSAAPLALLLLAGAAGVPEVEYPLGPLRVPDLTQPRRPFVLTDLRYALSDAGGRAHAFGARVRAGNWGFLGAELDDSSWGLTLRTLRLDLYGFETRGQYDVGAGYRFPWLEVHADVTRRREEAGAAWVADLRFAGRVSQDWELLAGVMRDGDRSAGPGRRHLDNAFLGFLYQGGEHVELRGELARYRVLTDGGDEIEGGFLGLDAVGRVWTGEVSGRVAWEDPRGRFGFDDVQVEAGLRLPLLDRLLVEASTHQRWQGGAGRIAHGLRGGVSLHARRVTLPRFGDAARRTTALARRGVELGYNERRAHGEGGRRELRERLSLSPRRAELADDLAALYQAQVDERIVPVLGVELVHEQDLLRGERRREYRAFLGLPWPLASPLRPGRGATPFLEVDYAHVERSFEAGFVSVSRELGLTARLSRELELLLRWGREGQAPFDLVRNVGRPRRIDFAIVYAYGR